MRSLSRLLGTLLLTCAPLAPALATPEAEPHVILISIDGLRPATYLDPAAHDLELPNLTRLMEGGAYARGVEGIFPSVTYPSHTTLITGVPSAVHGVYANSLFQPEKRGPSDWFWFTDAIKVPTLWHAAQDAGLFVANLSWPVSGGCPCDLNIPEIWDNSSREQPDSMRILREHSQPTDLIDTMNAATGEVWTDKNYHINVLERDLVLARGAAWLITEYQPNLLTIHLIEVDHESHEEGPEGPTARLAIEYADQAVGLIWAAVEEAGLADSTTIVITGDHGFADITQSLSPNLWLEETGWVQGNPRDGGYWEALFLTTAASAALMLKDPTDTALGVEIQEYVAAQLADFPEGERPADLVTREELDALGSFPGAVFALNPRPGWDINGRLGAEALTGTTDGGTHGYLPSWEAMHTGLILYGNGIDPEGEAGIVPMLQIAPTLAQLLGVELPTATADPLDWALEGRG